MKDEEGTMGMCRRLFVWSLAPRRYQAARVQLHCPATDTHTRELILEQATVYADGWAQWDEDGHVIIRYLQARPCCDPPAVSEV